jgi:outer membrane putative beta-barrel porin/alpha-amylase
MRPGHAHAAPLALAAVLSLASSIHAQSVDDHVMMPRRNLCAVASYTHESWDQYWEGALERGNGNVGTVTTESFGPSAAYGISDRLNVIAMLPYVKTHASQGVLHGMSGWQDLTVALKFNALETPFTSHGALRTILVVSGGTPVSDYTPDFLPLSIGSHSRSLSGRLTLGFQAHAGWFLEGSGAYTRRGDVKLDRPYYYTDGQLFLSDEVAMPDVFDYKVAAGYLKHGFYAPLYFQQRITRGGGDIRRQDSPFVSNRMNASRVGAFVQYSLPMARRLALKVEGAYTVDGRNVGQATSLTGGLLYTFRF